MTVMPMQDVDYEMKMNDTDKGIIHPKGNTYPEFGDVADVDHLWGVIQEAAKASQPHQILFVF